MSTFPQRAPSSYSANRRSFCRYHALEFGREAYFLLREPALRACSLTYYVNEARHGGAPGAPANVAYKVVRPRDGGVALGLHVLAPVEAGCELLANYDQRLALS